MNRFTLTMMSALALSSAMSASPDTSVHLSRLNPISKSPGIFAGTTVSPQGRNTSRPSRIADINGASLAGNLIYSNFWNGVNEYGIYSLDILDNTVAQQPVAVNNLYAGGGGVYIPSEDIYVAISYQNAMGLIVDPIIQVFDANTWELISTTPCSARCIAFDLTYNPADGKVYGSFLADESQSGIYFGILDYKNASTTQIAHITYPFAAIMADGSGDLFTIEAGTGVLAKITPEGERTVIGDTGYSPSYLQSGTIDYKTGQAYWCASSEDGAALYTVDLSNARLTEIADWNDSLFEWVGLFSSAQYAPAGAPAAPESLSVTFDGNYSATGSFHVPTITTSGKPISGSLTYNLYIDGTKYMEGNVTAGSDAKINFESPEGFHSYAITLTNDEGMSPFTVSKAFCGVDTPTRPQNVVSKIIGQTASISWDAVTSSVHGGFMDINDLTYTVTRMPDGLTVAENIKETSAIDTDNPEKLALYRYEVVATSSSIDSEAGVSGGVVRGNPLKPGYVSDFDNAEDRMLYTIIDANEDGATWIEKEDNGSICFRYRYSEEGCSADDWIISMPFFLEKGKSYKIITCAEYVGEGEEIEVKAGRSPQPEAMTIPVASSNEITLEDDVTDLSTSSFVYFTPDDTGVYYFGFHAVSPPNRFYLFLRRWAIEEGVNPEAPAEVTQASATPGAKGDRSVVLKFMTPSKACDASTLSSISRVEIYNPILDMTEVIEDAEPGKEYTIDNLEVDDELMIFDITAFNSKGRGRTLRQSCWIGNDYPGPVDNPYWTADGEDAIISWNPPTESKNGGYFDPDYLTYRIVTYYPDFDFLETRWEDVSYTDNTIRNLDGQISLYYNITARSEKGIGVQTITNAGPFGNPYKLPFKESFENGSLDHTGWGFSNPDINLAMSYWQSAPEGYYDSCFQPLDDDGGLLYFYPNLGGENLLFSPLVLISDANPQLSLYCMQPDADSSVEILISTDAARTWTTLFTTTPALSPQWDEYKVDLSAYKDKVICLGIKGYAKHGSPGMAIDNITITGDDTSVDAVGMDKIVSTKWYTISGLEVNNPSKGQLLIKTVTSSDGHTTVSKVIVK